MTTLVNNLLLSVLVVVGLIVLVAMGKVPSDVGVPIIATIGGVHVGGQLSSPTPIVTPVTGNPPPVPPK